MRVASNTAAAEAAVSGFAGIEVDNTGQQVNLGSSNIGSMKDGAALSNKLLKDISEVAAGVKAEADRVTALASRIETQDQQDASSMGLRS